MSGCVEKGSLAKADSRLGKRHLDYMHKLLSLNTSNRQPVLPFDSTASISYIGYRNQRYNSPNNFLRA
jgi:hypothetical protein